MSTIKERIEEIEKEAEALVHSLYEDYKSGVTKVSHLDISAKIAKVREAKDEALKKLQALESDAKAKVVKAIKLVI